jgi:hypothetical protein
MVIHSEEYYAAPQRVLSEVIAFVGVTQPSAQLWEKILVAPVAEQGVHTEPMHPETRELLTEFYKPFQCRLDAMLKTA